MAAPDERDGEGDETRGEGAERTLGDATLGDERNDGVLGAERKLGVDEERKLDEGMAALGAEERYDGEAEMLGEERKLGGGDATLGCDER
jgi:hypothetical protein